MITNAEMERVLENLDRRLATVEQVLPTLATKADLDDAVTGAERHARILFESLQERLQLVAERVLDLRGQFKHLKSDLSGVKTDVGGVSVQLAALIARLERKGVI